VLSVADTSGKTRKSSTLTGVAGHFRFCRLDRGLGIGASVERSPRRQGLCEAPAHRGIASRCGPIVRREQPVKLRLAQGFSEVCDELVETRLVARRFRVRVRGRGRWRCVQGLHFSAQRAENYVVSGCERKRK
jgi:hypothetical protein